MTIEIDLWTDVNKNHKYAIHIRNYELADRDELVLLKDIDMQIDEWIHELEEEEKERLPFN